MGMAAILVMGPLSFPRPMEAPYKIWIQMAQWLLRGRCLKMLTTDGRQMPTTTISLAMNLQLRWAKNIYN